MQKLRDSVVYRSEALLWHRELLRRMHEAGPNAMRATLLTANPREAAWDTARSLRQQQQFTFDSVVFHADSLFDYVANAVAYAFYRTGMKWRRLMQCASDPKLELEYYYGGRISGGAVGQAIRGAQAAFVRPLAEYRGGVIHVEIERAPANYAFDMKVGGPQALSDVSAQLTVRVPPPFAKRFTIPGYEADPTQATLNDAAERIVEQTHTHATSVLRQLERDLRCEFGDPDATDRVIQMH